MNEWSPSWLIPSTTRTYEHAGGMDAGVYSWDGCTAPALHHSQRSSSSGSSSCCPLLWLWSCFPGSCPAFISRGGWWDMVRQVPGTLVWSFAVRSNGATWNQELSPPLTFRSAGLKSRKKRSRLPRGTPTHVRARFLCTDDFATLTLF